MHVNDTCRRCQELWWIESPGLLLGAPGGAGERGEQVEVVVVRLRHRHVRGRRRRRLRLQRREAPGLRRPRRRRQGRPERGRGCRGAGVAFLARALAEDGLLVVVGGGGRGRRGGGDEDGRGSARPRGGEDGCNNLIFKYKSKFRIHQSLNEI